eukprot:PhF_6_TR30822/c0_g1_i1/m.45369
MSRSSLFNIFVGTMVLIVLGSLFMTLTPKNNGPYMIHTRAPYVDIHKTFPGTDAPSAPHEVTFVSKAQPTLPVLKSESVEPTYIESSDVRRCHNKPSRSPNSLSRYITFDAPEPKYGLANQLTVYAAALFMSHLTERHLAIPNGTIPNYFDLMDPELTAAKCLPCGIGIRYIDFFAPPEPPAKKFKRYHLPGRGDARDPEKREEARRLMNKDLLRSKFTKQRGVRTSALLWHVPYLPSDKNYGESYFYSCLTFSAAVRNFAKRIQQAIGEKYVALHLRLEPDIVAIEAHSRKIKRPSENELASFFSKCLPASLHNYSLYISAGGLDEKYISAMRRLPFRKVIFKKDLGLKMSQQVHSDSFVPGYKITNHFEAAADLMVVTEGYAAISADYSSFARAIQIRRCVKNMKSVIFTYDSDWIGMTRRDCVENLESTPFHALVEYKELAKP